VVGAEYGSAARTSTGQTVYLMKPTIEDFIMRGERRTQIVYPKDMGIIAARINARTGSRILEIGSGLGVLTYYLAAVCGNVLSIELDSRLSSIAHNVVKYVDASIVNGDGMDFIGLPRFHQLVSNTPYYLSGMMIARLASNNSIQTASLLVQKEVGERVTAEPGDPSYGRISVISQLFFSIEVKRVYPPSFFYPKPEVSGVLLCLKRKKKWIKNLHGSLEKFTACLFSGRNKMASKQVSKCTGINRSDLSWLGKRRVREMTPWEIEKLLADAY